MAEFGDRLRRLRGDRPQKEIAQQLGMPVTTYSTLENQDSIPRGQVLKRLSKAFSVPMTYFYSTPASEFRSTAAARNWLETIRKRDYAQQNTAAHADIDLPPETRMKLAEKIAERVKVSKDGKASDQH